MRILITGDSLALPRPYFINDYNPAKDHELAVSYDQTYGSLLQKELSQLYPEKYIELINRGQRAFTIKHVENQIIDHTYFFEPDIIILHVGIVDCWFRAELNSKQYVDIQSFEKAAQHIVNIINSTKTTKIIIIGICPTSMKMERRNKGLLKEITKYNEVFKKYIEHNRIFYVDMEKHINPNNPHKYLLPDDHHLNRDGNYLIFNELKNLVCAFIESDLGVEYFEISKNIGGANEHFKRSYSYFPIYLDNLYNLLTLSYELKEYNYLKSIISAIKNFHIEKHEIINLLQFLKDEFGDY